MAFITSERYGKAWQGSLLVGSLKFRYLARLQLDGQRVLLEENCCQTWAKGCAMSAKGRTA